VEILSHPLSVAVIAGIVLMAIGYRLFLRKEKWKEDRKIILILKERLIYYELYMRWVREPQNYDYFDYCMVEEGIRNLHLPKYRSDKIDWFCHMDNVCVETLKWCHPNIEHIMEEDYSPYDEGYYIKDASDNVELLKKLLK